jgi:hypothetical protein
LRVVEADQARGDRVRDVQDLDAVLVVGEVGEALVADLEIVRDRAEARLIRPHQARIARIRHVVDPNRGVHVLLGHVEGSTVRREPRRMREAQWRVEDLGEDRRR